MSVVISDTSPIRALSQLDLLSLLSDLYADVFIPSAVAEELARRSKILGSLKPEELSLFRVVDPTIGIDAPREFWQLDPGERDAIRLAIELSADGLLIDERLGRRVASAMHLHTIGTLGILGQGKRRGLIDAVAPLIERLQTEINFFISPSLKKVVHRDLGELP